MTFGSEIPSPVCHDEENALGHLEESLLSSTILERPIPDS